jgi:DNA-binding GntR family transcriptional regulator
MLYISCIVEEERSVTLNSTRTVVRPDSRRHQLPEEVASYVRELIMSGQVKPGEFLRMEPIADAMGISNTPVREGLLSLRGEGFVRLVPRRGFMVATFTEQDIRDLFWAQGMLAGELASRAASRISSAQLEELETLLARYEVAIRDDDGEAVAALGHEFHRQVNIAADAYRLALLLGAFVKQFPNKFYATIDGHVDATRNEHPELFAAIRDRNPLRSRRLMEQHIVQGAQRLIDTLAERGVWTESP